MDTKKIGNGVARCHRTDITLKLIVMCLVVPYMVRAGMVVSDVSCLFTSCQENYKLAHSGHG